MSLDAKKIDEKVMKVTLNNRAISQSIAYASKNSYQSINH